MKAAFVIVVALVICGAFADNMYDQFMDWCMKYNKVYNSAEEHVARFNAFKGNVATIRHLNRLNTTATFGLNAFSDLTYEEFAARYLMKIPVSSSALANVAADMDTFEYDPSNNYPSHLNLTKEGYVTPVKDQGHCGSCWAFSAVGAMEGAWYHAHKKLPNLSEQQLVDCATGCVKYPSYSLCNYGCDGGFPQVALWYAVKYGMVTTGSYPYKAVQQKCQLKGSKFNFNFNNVRSVRPDENDMIAALNEVGPLSVAVFVSEAFKHYTGGVFTGPWTKGKLNHGVVLVGYGSTKKGVKYWLVKNSWSTGWGVKGYIYIARGTGKNVCNIQDAVYFPEAK